MPVSKARLLRVCVLRMLDLRCGLCCFALGLDGASKQIEPRSADLKNEAVTSLRLSYRESLVLNIMISKGIAKEAEHRFRELGELVELMEAKNRMTVASQKAGAVLEEYDQKEAEKSAPRRETETQRALREFLEKRRMEEKKHPNPGGRSVRKIMTAIASNDFCMVTSNWRRWFFGLISRRLSQMRGVWRRHLEQDVSRAKSGRRTGNVGGGAIALLSLLVIIICAGAVLALTQIKSLKSEIATLQRELSPLKARIAKVDSDDKAKRDANQQKESQIKSGVEKNRIGPDPGSDQAALNLTSEEVRLIRDFIKPAPVTGTPAPAIKVGDMVSFATIPLPSPLMEKIPKLLGARFATRNGSIIILRRDSRQADVVLPPS